MFLAMLPSRFIESGVGTWIAEPIAPSVWIFGGVFVVLCVAACVEGSRGDRIVLCIGALLTFWFIREFFVLMLLRVRPSPA